MLINSIKPYHNVYIFQDNMFYPINIFCQLKIKKLVKILMSISMRKYLISDQIIHAPLKFFMLMNKKNSSCL